MAHAAAQNNGGLSAAYVPVAQLVAQRTFNPCVAGSIPAWGTPSLPSFLSSMPAPQAGPFPFMELV